MRIATIMAAARRATAWWRPLHSALAVAVIIQAAMVAVAFWPSRSGASSARAALDITADQVSSIVIRDASGQSIGLTKQAGWTLDDSDGYPAKETAVTDFMNRILQLRTDRLVTRTPSSQARLRVAEDAYERRITLTTTEGYRHEIFLGTSAGYGATHFRVGGDDATYLTNAVTSWVASTTPASWIDTGYIDLVADATRIRVTNAAGTYTLVADESGTWGLEDLGAHETGNQATIASIANRALRLNMVRPVGKQDKPEYGLNVPAATVVVTTGAGDVTWVVGALDEATQTYVVKASSSDYFVRASDYTVRDLIGKMRQDLLQPPATPTPASVAN